MERNGNLVRLKNMKVNSQRRIFYVRNIQIKVEDERGFRKEDALL